MENKEQQLIQSTSDIIKFDSKSFVEQIKKNVLSGNIDPLAAFTVIKRMNKVSEEILKDNEIKTLAENEADKYLVGSAKKFDFYGANISKRTTYTWYDFSECGHPVLEQLYQIQKEVKESIKLLEDELKLLIKPEGKMTLGIENTDKQIVVNKIPFLKWEDTDDQVTVKAPQKISQIGLFFNKI